MLKLWIDILGWTGSGLVLIAYLLISGQKLSANSLVYQLMNIAGSAFLIINTFYYGAVPSAALNVVWMGIGIFSIFRFRKNTATE